MDLKQISDWTTQSLIAHGYSALGALEEVQITPWSSVRRILTNQGHVFLKIMPTLLSLEPNIAEILQTQFHANVPIVIDKNIDLHCFLMKNAGKPYYHFKTHESRHHIIVDAINKYKFIQQQSALHVDTFLQLGVPDWRLARLPMLYDELSNQRDLLLADGMPIADIDTLPNLSAKFKMLCEELATFPILETLDHCDLHGANILVDENNLTITIIDWGETVITHPYLSLNTFMQNLVKYYGFQENDVWNACYVDDNINRQDLLTIVTLVNQIEPIYSALAFVRLMMSSDKETFYQAPNCKGRIAKHLLTYIQQNN